MVLAAPRLASESVKAVKKALSRFAGDVPESAACFAATGFSALRELPAGLMASMVPYASTTRAILASPG